MIEAIPDKLRMAKRKLEDLHAQVRAAEDELKREFPRTQELREKSSRLAQLNAELTLQERGNAPSTGGSNPDGGTPAQPAPPQTIEPEYVKTVNF